MSRPPRPASRPSRRAVLAAAAYALVLAGAMWLVAASCLTPERGSRLFDQGREAEALPLLEAAADRGSVAASRRLGTLLAAGRETPRDEARALSLFTYAAG